MKDLLLISIGSILGCWLRFIFVRLIKKRRSLKNYSIIIVNTIATFFVGLLYSYQVEWYFHSELSWIKTFLMIGFFGSLGTFSAFVFEIFDIIFIKKKLLLGLKVLTVSLLMGLIAAFAGYQLNSI